MNKRKTSTRSNKLGNENTKARHQAHKIEYARSLKRETAAMNRFKELMKKNAGKLAFGFC